MTNNNLKTGLTIILIMICFIINAQNQKKLDSLFTVIKTARHDTTRVKAYIGLCWEYNSSNPDTALYFGNLGLKLATVIASRRPEPVEGGAKQSHNDIYLAAQKGMAQCYNNIGVVYMYQGLYDKAIEYYLKSLKIYEGLLADCKDRKDCLPVRKGMSACYANIGSVHRNQGSYDKAIEYYLKALKIYEELLADCKDKKACLPVRQGMSDCYRSIGIVHSDQSNYDKAIEYYLKALKIKEESGDNKGMSDCYTNIGIVHYYQGLYDKAIEYYLKSLKIKEESGDKKGMSACYTNIGLVHHEQGSYDKAIEYYLMSLKIKEELGDKKGMSMCCNNIGLVHKDQGLYDKAIEYYLKALKIYVESGDKKGMSACYNNIGNVHLAQGSSSTNQKVRADKYDKAIEYYLKALKIDEESGDKNGIAIVWGNIASLHITLADSVATTQNEKIKHYNEAVNYGLKSLNLAREIKAIPMENSAAGFLQKAYKGLGNTIKALEYAEIFIATQDSMFKEEKTKALAGMEAKYQNEKKQLEIDKLGKEKELQLSENKKQRIVIFSVIAGLVLIIVFAVFVVNRLRITRKQKRIIETQKDEIEAQRDLVTEQKQHIENIHEELTDSIRYAERIQKAVLPSELYIKDKIQSEFFILFKPKDIVSGDFYFVEQRKHWLLIAVADCTGHGVPGGFMSMLGISFLNEIIAKEEIQSASHVLDELRNYVIHSLQQKGAMGEQKDGMDIAFVALNTDTNELQFAGANNPLYIVSGLKFEVLNFEKGDQNNIKQETPVLSRRPEFVEGEAEGSNIKLTEVKGDKMPVAIHDSMNNFTNQIIQLQKGDIIYLMSDGYEDQFGGPKGKKFYAKNLNQLLVENCIKPMLEQKEILDNTIENWKNNYEIKYEQTDDITVLGIKIN
ncbi:MAG: tetratricopeptide repeat protein [Bacteroidetes bacterium]|nr:tetratricopeptide repeat protein [Bacteroidota bacterium]